MFLETKINWSLVFGQISHVDIQVHLTYSTNSRATWGASGALYLQSAIAGLNSRPEVLVSQVRSEQSSAEDRILRNKELLNPVRTGR